MYSLPKISLILKKLLERMLEDIQHIPDEVDEENNACVPYRLGNIHYR